MKSLIYNGGLWFISKKLPIVTILPFKTKNACFQETFSFSTKKRSNRTSYSGLFWKNRQKKLVMTKLANNFPKIRIKDHKIVKI